MLAEVLNRAGSRFDELVSSAVFERRRSRSDKQAESLGHRDRIDALGQIAAIYDRPEHYEAKSAFFAEAAPISPELRRVRRAWQGSVIDASWESGFSPMVEAVADRYLSPAPNRRAAARLFLHDGPPRPAVLLVHGYLAGQYAVEERVWPVEWLFKGGLDVALPVLPFHAVRALPGPPVFPSSDPRVTNEGFRQAARDLRALVSFLLDRGAPSVGIMGMSLGGYTTSLIATIDDRLSFAVPFIPLASIAVAARQSGRFVGSEDDKRRQFEALERAHRAVSPLARPSKLDRDRVLVIGAAGDRITPIAHAEMLAQHFQAPLEVFPGGHLLQFGRAQGFRAAGRLMRRLGVMQRAR